MTSPFYWYHLKRNTFARFSAGSIVDYWRAVNHEGTFYAIDAGYWVWYGPLPNAPGPNGPGWTPIEDPVQHLMIDYMFERAEEVTHAQREAK